MSQGPRAQTPPPSPSGLDLLRDQLEDQKRYHSVSAKAEQETASILRDVRENLKQDRGSFLPFAIVATCGVCASLFCFLAGVYLLSLRAVQSDSMFEYLAHGIGLYFIGKGFYVGPALITSHRSRRS